MDILKRSGRVDIRKTPTGIQGYLFKFSEQISFFGELERFSTELKFKTNDSGCFLFRDHDMSRVLARSPDTLNFKKDDQGLMFSATPLTTPLWSETLELINKKVLSGMSIGFRAEKHRIENNVTIYEDIVIYESSIVCWPAYSTSTLESRAKEKLPEPLPPELF